MTNSEVGTQVSQPGCRDDADTGPIEGNKAASAFGAKPRPKTQSAEAHRVVNPKPKPKEPDEFLSCLRPKTDLYLAREGRFAAPD